jgi:hypothetical protein
VGHTGHRAAHGGLAGHGAAAAGVTAAAGLEAASATALGGEGTTAGHGGVWISVGLRSGEQLGVLRCDVFLPHLGPLYTCQVLMTLRIQSHFLELWLSIEM